MFHEHRSEDIGAATFDKDDDLAVDFVTAASNLRALCFGIPTQTAFHAKGMAGGLIMVVSSPFSMFSIALHSAYGDDDP